MNDADRLAALIRENTELRAQLSHVGELLARIDELVHALAKANDRIAELMAIAQRKKAGRRSPAPAPDPAPAPSVSEEAGAAFTARPQPSEPPGPMYDHPRPRPRPSGRKPLPPHLDTAETITWPEQCSCGCAAFDWVDEVVEEKLDVRPHQRRRVTRRKTGRCRACGQRSTGDAPPSPFPRSKVTCEWLAWLVVQKFQLAVPLDRVRRLLGVQGMALSTSFLVSMVERAADLLSSIDGLHWRTLLKGSHLASDGTGIKVQVPGIGLHHGYFEVYHWGDTVCFQYEAEKGGQTQASKLQPFAGTLLVDAESRYNLSFADGRLTEAGCNAHGRRKFKDAGVVQPLLAAEGGRFIASWFEAEEGARNLGLGGEALLARRQEKITPLVEEFRAWCDAVDPTLVVGDALRKVVAYYRKHWAALTRFLEDPALPLDNSASEREFQFVAKIRLNSLFAGGTEGAHRAAVLLGIAATCRRLKVDLFAYLTWVFVRLGTHRDRFGLPIAELTPAAYTRAHPRPAGA